MEGFEMVVKLVYDNFIGVLGRESEKEYNCECHSDYIISSRDVNPDLTIFQFLAFQARLKQDIPPNSDLNPCDTISVRYLLGINQWARTIYHQISDLTILRDVADVIMPNMQEANLPVGVTNTDFCGTDVYYQSTNRAARFNDLLTYSRVYAKNLEMVKVYLEEWENKRREAVKHP